MNHRSFISTNPELVAVGIGFRPDQLDELASCHPRTVLKLLGRSHILTTIIYSALALGHWEEAVEKLEFA